MNRSSHEPHSVLSDGSLVAPRNFREVLERYRIDLTDLHPVARVVVERASQVPVNGVFPDGHKLGLVVEGGAMRGIVSLGMLVFLEQLGATHVFDNVYGSSAGAINSSFFIARQAGMAATVYCNEMLTSGFISYKRLLKRQSIVSVEYLLDDVVEIGKPLDWDGVAHARSRLHPIAFSISRLEAVDLAPLEDKSDVKEALRATARVPIFAGPPVPFRGDSYFDATMTRSIPYEHAIEHGCTHILVLRTRHLSSFRSAPSWFEKQLTERGLRKLDPRLIEIFHNRAVRYREEVEDLKLRSSGTVGGPAVLQVAPEPDQPEVGSFSRSHAEVLLGAMTGMRAASRCLLNRDCRPIEEIRAFYT